MPAATAACPTRCIPLDELPPSEAEIAAWLHEIVRGEALDGGEDQQQDGDDVAGSGCTPVDDEELAKYKMEKLQTSTKEGRKCAEDSTRSNSSERKQKTTAGARRSQIAETHRLTEKKRRCKINESMKTLQQLIPGCDKYNQASTLDRTIQYMKSLQQQIQAMSFRRSMKPAAVYPVVPPPVVPGGLPLMPAADPGALGSGNAPPAAVLGPPPAMVPFAPPLLPAAHQFPAIILAPMLYPDVAPLPARRPASAACRRKRNN